MKRQKITDKYGFAICDSYRTTKTIGTCVNICYENRKTLEEASICYPYQSTGLLKGVSQYMEIEKQFYQMNIIEAFAHTIKTRYGHKDDFEENSDLFDILLDIPDSLIMSDDAMMDLLSKVPQSNKVLLVYVMQKIKQRRTYIKYTNSKNDEVSFQEIEVTNEA